MWRWGEVALAATLAISLVSEAAADTAPKPNVCRGGDNVATVQVALDVDPSTGRPLKALALWHVRGSGGAAAPMLDLAYPMEKGTVAANPSEAILGGAVILDVRTPLPRTASVALLADHVAMATAPWAGYADIRTKMDGNPPADGFAAFLVITPVLPQAPDGKPDAGVERLFSAIGAGKVRSLAARAVGDDGRVLFQLPFDLTSADIRNRDLVRAALQDAESKAKAPYHCGPEPPAPDPTP